MTEVEALQHLEVLLHDVDTERRIAEQDGVSRVPLRHHGEAVFDAQIALAVSVQDHVQHANLNRLLAVVCAPDGIVYARALLLRVVQGRDQKVAAAAGRVLDRVAGSGVHERDDEVHNLGGREVLRHLPAVDVLGEVHVEVLEHGATRAEDRDRREDGRQRAQHRA